VTTSVTAPGDTNLSDATGNWTSRPRMDSPADYRSLYRLALAINPTIFYLFSKLLVV